MKPRALDLFCGAGGASMGLHRAGFDVTGIDIKPQPRYPFRFIQGDALSPPVRLSDFDLIWASPPCQAHSTMKNMANSRSYPDLIPDTRRMLEGCGGEWVIENVPGAPMLGAFVLCGSQFGLPVRRHRLFEASFFVLTIPCTHGHSPVITVLSRGGGGRKGKPSPPLPVRKRAMGIDWCDDYGLSQAIPPAYAQHIGEYAMMAINAR